MRILGNNIINKIEFFDKISESDLTLFYRLPTVVERIKYSNEIYTRQNNKILLNPEVRLEYALKIVTGIGENQFADTNNKPISSDNKNENFNPAWKSLLKESAAELLMVLAFRVFEGLTEKVNGKKTDIPESEESTDEAIEVDLKGGNEINSNPFPEN